MRLAHPHIAILVLAITVVACGGTDSPDGTAAEAMMADQPAAAAPPPAPTNAPAAGTGTAQVKLTGGGADIDGSFPTTVCGGSFGIDAGVAYQVQAGEWKITVGSGERVSGDVPLNDASGDVNVAVTANGPGVQLVRGPRNGGSLRISEDFDRADADLELRPLLGGETVRLVATFTCS
ncbi:MAG: hypothetical protein ACYC2G_06040 [Gemmatimonadaceae bacterium]